MLKCLSIACFVAFTLAIGLSGLVPPALAAEDAIDASYQWVSMQDLGDGTSQATLTFTFSNNGDQYIDDMNVILLISPTHLLADPDQTLSVGRLWITETASITADVRFHGPVFEQSGLLLIADGHEADGSGDPMVLLIEQEAAQ